MDVLSYLTVLIKTRKEVGIPGLGTIFKKKSPGRYDAGTHSFLPPSYVLDFSEELREQNLLIDYICKKRNISADSAGYYVGQFAEEINKQLEEGQQADLQPLGSLSRTDGNLTFIPASDQNFGFDFFGLPTVKDEVASIVENNPESQETVETTDQPEPLADDVEAVIEENHILEENPGDGTAEHQVTEDQLNLENSNADLREESDETIEEAVIDDEQTPEQPQATSEQQSDPDEQPVFEEIAEVAPPVKTIPQPEIETVEGIAAAEEEIIPAAKPSINEIYAQSNKPLSNVVPPVKAEETVFYNSNEDSSDKVSTPLYLKILIALLIILMAVAAVYFIRPDLFGQPLKKHDDAVAVPVKPTAEQVKHTIDSLERADSIKHAETPLPSIDSVKKDTLVHPKTATQKSVNSKPDVVTTAPVAAPQPVQTGTTYEVIGSSVSSEREAAHFIEQMKSRGIIAKAIPPEKGRKKIKISIGTFKDDASARAERAKLEQKLGIEGIYIYTNKPQ